MEAVSYIQYSELPKELNFLELKEEALAYIQKYAGDAWTNLNPSDPGITILDQLCYALTELGYCGNFPVKDILSDEDNNVQIENQFFLPENILTTNPVTIKDYQKLVINGVTGVRNILIDKLETGSLFTYAVYTSYVLVDFSLTKEEKLSCTIEAYFLLNQHRNLGEYFITPRLLVSKKSKVNGALELETGYQLNKVLAAISEAINDYVFPKVVQTGYEQLKEEGESTNEIFNGPILSSGWIPDDSVKTKKNSIHAFEITKIIQSIPGVKSINNLSFDSDRKNKITSKEDEILVLDVIGTLQEKGNHQFSIHAQHQSLDRGVIPSIIEAFNRIETSGVQKNKVASVSLAPKEPTGNYRDISSYYSIQNTFPQAYAVGENAIDSNASEFQIAQSRQLKGYLTIFDQVLSNQFAQLGNLKSLFSFQNAVTGDPEDSNYFFATQSEFDKYHSEYPVPYQSFSPTYFYQSLYTAVPNIKDLLRNSDKFKYSLIPESKNSLEKQAWHKFKRDPYNTYIHGLMDIMENEKINLDRRNTILDHLLARHGISPEMIDTIISSPVYTDNLVQDRVIIKSLFLQNYQQLSYNRAKGYNFLAAATLQNIEDDSQPVLLRDARQEYQQEQHHDFIFQTKKVDKQFGKKNREKCNCLKSFCLTCQ